MLLRTAKMYDVAGVKSEATIYSYDEQDQPLPPGTWRVQVNGEKSSTVMSLEQMPAHWVAQIERWTKLGTTLE